LKPSDYETYRDELRLRRQEGTCTWLLNDKRYKKWNDVDGQAILWIRGDPGCGKSVLSSFLTEEVIHGSNQLSLAYFFCDDKDERLRTANAILVNILAQLLKYIPDAIVHFSTELGYATDKEKTIWTLGMLWRVFERIINDANTGNVCILIDALGNSILQDE
jgi:Cdc6-like AAA superfamily ATPase